MNCIIQQDFDRARRAAADADAERTWGGEAPLLGVPVTVKESIDTVGRASTAGVPDRVGHVAEYDAPTVARLRSAGAVILGKTNVCTWLADFQATNPVYGQTNSPWDHSLTPGGSSGGSAGLAAGLGAIDLASDMGGSIRVPAAFCGLWGHKPSSGLLPGSGHFPGFAGPNPAAVLATQGPMARSAVDLELVMETLAGPDIGVDTAWYVRLPAPRRKRLADFRVAILPAVPWCPVDGEILAAMDSLATNLRKAGATVAEAQPREMGDFREHYALFRALMWVATSCRQPADRREAMALDKMARGEEFQAADARGLRGSAGDYLVWMERRETFRAFFRSFFRDWDVLLTPATLVPAFPHATGLTADRRLEIGGRPVEFDYMSFYPSVATLCGQPGTAIPIGHNASGLPLGAQVVGPFLEDMTGIRFARLVEQEFGRFKPPPSYAAEFV